MLHLSLSKRVDIINKRYDIKISDFLLRCIYKRNRISFRLPYVNSYSGAFLKAATVEKDRTIFAKRLAHLIFVEKRTVLYYDETSFRFEDEFKVQRKWQHRDHTVTIPGPFQPRKTAGSIGLIFAVSETLIDGHHYKFVKISNTESIV